MSTIISLHHSQQHPYIKHEVVIKNKKTPWAHIRWRCVSSRGHRSLTAPMSKVTISLPMAVCPCIRWSGCDWWHQRKRVFGGGEASLAASDEAEPRDEEEEATFLFIPPLVSSCPVCDWSAPPPAALRAPALWTLWWRCL